MIFMLEKVLLWAERQLPESQRTWISDLRTEAGHLPGNLAKLAFLWSGVIAALGQILRYRIGVRRVGQTLLGLALFLLCLGGLIITKDMPNDIVKITFYGALTLYALAGSLILLDLRLMKRFTFVCSLILVAVCVLLGSDVVPALGVHSEFLSAFALEAAFMMAGLFVAASYLGWIEEVEHA